MVYLVVVKGVEKPRRRLLQRELTPPGLFLVFAGASEHWVFFLDLRFYFSSSHGSILLSLVAVKVSPIFLFLLLRGRLFNCLQPVFL